MFVWRWAVVLALARGLLPLAGTPPPPLPRDPIGLDGGTFVMGTDPSRVDALCERYRTTHRDLFLPETPAHTVTVRPFSIDCTEVTNAEYKAFVDRHPEWAPGRVPAERQNGDYLKPWAGGTFPRGAADLPVTYVTWWAATAYCESNGRRLPTEAEWEFAARGGLASAEFPWGDEAPDPTRANWAGTNLGAPTRVESFPPNPYGLYEMAISGSGTVTAIPRPGRARTSAFAAPAPRSAERRAPRYNWVPCAHARRRRFSFLPPGWHCSAGTRQFASAWVRRDRSISS